MTKDVLSGWADLVCKGNAQCVTDSTYLSERVDSENVILQRSQKPGIFRALLLLELQSAKTSMGVCAT